MVSKHTPGPWGWYGPNLLCGGERQSEDILKSADDGKPYGMQSALIEHHWNGDVAKANASLIAAAPDLLEALKAILRDPTGCRFCDMGRPRKSMLTDQLCEHDEQCGFLLARAAIDKAEGDGA